MDQLVLSLPENAIFTDSEYLHEIMLPPGGVRPSDQHWKRVTQLAAVRVEAGTISGRFCELVRPGPPQDYPPEMWRLHEELTHLSTKHVLAARSLPAVFDDFNNFCGSLPVVVMLGDHEVHRRNMLEYGKDISAQTAKYFRLKPALVAVDSSYSPLCSGELHKVVGLHASDVMKACGNSNAAAAHDALFDSASMALFVTRKRAEAISRQKK